MTGSSYTTYRMTGNTTEHEGAQSLPLPHFLLQYKYLNLVDDGILSNGYRDVYMLLPRTHAFCGKRYIACAIDVGLLNDRQDYPGKSKCAT